MPAGRPTKLTPELQEKIVRALTAGNTRTASIAYAGISYETFLDWMREPKVSRKPYSEFSEAIKKAEAEAELHSVVIIRRAAESNWQAAAWWLERRRHKDWMKRESVEQNVEIKQPKPLRVAVIDDKDNKNDE